MSLTERKLPTIDLICIATMILVVIGGIYVAAKLPQEVPLGLPIALTAVAGGLVAVNLVLLSRLRDFAWHYFRLVAAWSFVAYLAISGMLEFAFLRNDTPDDVMVLLTAQLLVYAVNIPLLLGFSVARYQSVDEESA